MQTRSKFLFALAALAFSANSFAQTESVQNAAADEELKLAALEALIAAPGDRALPLVTKVLSGNHSDEVKSRALFVLSQIDDPAAQTQLMETARQSDGQLQEEAIRMIGIGGNEEALASLADLYRSGDKDVRDAVLEAYLIADDARNIYDLAVNAESEADFEAAVEMLGAMGAHEELRMLRDSAGVTNSLIEAYAISGDVETLRQIALDDSDPRQQVRAIEALGIAGDSAAGSTLTQIYRGSDSPDIREAALQGLLIAGDADALLELYRESSSTDEKRRLLEVLTITGSDLVLEVIDDALAGDL